MQNLGTLGYTPRLVAIVHEDAGAEGYRPFITLDGKVAAEIVFDKDRAAFKVRGRFCFGFSIRLSHCRKT